MKILHIILPIILLGTFSCTISYNNNVPYSIFDPVDTSTRDINNREYREFMNIDVDNSLNQPTSDTKNLFVYFIAPVTSDTISKLIKGIDERLSVNNIKEVILFINSAGGETSYGLAAYKYLKNIEVKLKTYNLSTVSSAATFLYCAGDERYSIDGSSFLFHDLTANLNNSDMDEVILRGEMMKIERDSMMNIYRQCLNDDDELINTIFRQGVIISTPTDESIGLTNKVIQKIPSPRKGDILF